MSSEDKDLPPGDGGLQGDEDFHLREEVVKTGFSDEDDRIHALGLAKIDEWLKGGKAWGWIERSLKIADAELKAIVLDDYVKMTVARRHFQGGESLKQVSREAKIPHERLIKAKEEMLEEVKDASVKAYHLTRQREAGGAGNA
ncbi:MAG: hypothetical protein H7831_07595 [Magnetococcus sp. WYHC-3]